MFEVNFLQLFIKGIPEGLLLILGLYIISGTKLDTKRFVISGVLYALVTYAIRLLPISFGIHTLIIFFFVVLIANSINGIEVSSVIKATLILDMCILICELLNVLLLQLIFGSQTQALLQDATKKTIYGIPSTLIFALIIFIIYKFKNRKSEQ